MNVQELIKKMQLHATGANIHTVNKAITYLDALNDKPNILRNCFKSPEVVLNKLYTLCAAAIIDNNWKAVDIYLRGWF